MANFETNLGISWQTLWEWTLNTYHKNALSSQAAKYWISLFSLSTTRINDSCGITLNFLKEYKPRSCVKLRMIDERDGTFLGKHWNVILYQFVLDFTDVNAGIGSFTKLHINVHVIQHALSDRVLFPPLLSSIFPLRTKLAQNSQVCFKVCHLIDSYVMKFPSSNHTSQTACQKFCEIHCNNIKIVGFFLNL